MVKHIVAQNCQSHLTQKEKQEHMAKIKALLEGLKDVIPGIVEFTVQIDLLPASNREIVFDSTFESAEALAAYQTHPEHVKLLDYIRSILTDRICVDYEI